MNAALAYWWLVLWIGFVALEVTGMRLAVKRVLHDSDRISDEGQEILQRMARRFDAPRVEFRVISSRTPYAFAVLLPTLPRVVLGSKLLLAPWPVIEAAVAHELGHIAHKHTLRSFLWTWGIALLGLAVLAALVEMSPIMIVLLWPLWKASEAQRHALLRKQELEADAWAVERVGVSAMVSTLLHFARAMGPASNRGSDSHPSLNERLAAL